MTRTRSTHARRAKPAGACDHTQSLALLRPDGGIRAQFKNIQFPKQQLALVADPQRDLSERVPRTCEHRPGSLHCLFPGDSPVMVNSRLEQDRDSGTQQMCAAPA